MGDAFIKREENYNSGYLNIYRMKDLNSNRKTDAVIQSVEFHQSKEGLLLTAALDKRLTLFQMEEDTSQVLQTIFFEDLPMHQASFTPWQRVICTGRRSFYYSYDLTKAYAERVQVVFGEGDKSYESFAIEHNSPNPVVAFFGNEGCIPLLSLKSNLAIGQLKLNGSVRCAAFSGVPHSLWTLVGDGLLSNWDLRMNRCIDRVVDSGATKGISLACSLDGRWVATGSETGFVNIYSCNNLRSTVSTHNLMGPRDTTIVPPEKVIIGISTSIDTIKFSPDCQMLVTASRLRSDSLRMIHMQTAQPYSNWPTSKTPLGHVHSVAFSPGNTTLAIGNEKGRVLMYRLHN